MSTWYTTTIDTEMLDQICHQYYGMASKAIEWVFSSRENAHLADIVQENTTLPLGTKVFLPDIPQGYLIPTSSRKIRIFE